METQRVGNRFTSHIEAGATPVAVQQLLGHQSLKTTERYFHMTDQHMKDTVALLDQKSGQKKATDDDYMTTKPKKELDSISVTT